MESEVEEARKAKENAEKLFAAKDFAGAKRSALKAQAFYPQLEGIAQMVATFEIHAASVAKINGKIDLYSVLGLDPSAEKSIVKKQYKKMAILLHPDKNKTIGADEAFKLVSEAWTFLSDNTKRSLRDVRRNKKLKAMVAPPSGVIRLDTFWTVCTSCRVQYEYLRKYVNKKLSCKNCRGVFVAVETGAVPVTYCPWASFHSGNGPEFTNNVKTSAISNPNEMNLVHKSDGETPVVKLGRSSKKRKIEVGDGEVGSIGEPNASFDARKLLIDKARSVIRVKLEEMKMLRKLSDFHDFGMDRSVEVFKAKQYGRYMMKKMGCCEFTV